MRAVTFSRLGGPEVLEVSELPEPTPGDGEVRIRVVAATVNPTDISFRSGRQFTVDQLAEMGVRPPFHPRHGAGRRGRRRRRARDLPARRARDGDRQPSPSEPAADYIPVRRPVNGIAPSPAGVLRFAPALRVTEAKPAGGDPTGSSAAGDSPWSVRSSLVSAAAVAPAPSHGGRGRLPPGALADQRPRTGLQGRRLSRLNHKGRVRHGKSTGVCGGGGGAGVAGDGGAAGGGGDAGPLARLGHRVGRGEGADDYVLRAVVAAGSAACEHILESRPGIGRMARLWVMR